MTLFTFCWSSWRKVWQQWRIWPLSWELYKHTVFEFLTNSYTLKKAPGDNTGRKKSFVLRYWCTALMSVCWTSLQRWSDGHIFRKGSIHQCHLWTRKRWCLFDSLLTLRDLHLCNCYPLSHCLECIALLKCTLDILWLNWDVPAFW